MVQLQELQSEFEALSISLVSVSVDPPVNTAATKEKTGVKYACLSDEAGKLLDAFGLRHEDGNAMDGSDISRPAIIMLDRNGKLLLSEVTTNYRVRPTAKQILDGLKSMDIQKQTQQTIKP